MRRLLLALGLALAGTVAPCAWDAITPMNRTAALCVQVLENNGGPVILVKIHDNPTVWDTQFATGALRWEC